MAKLFNLISGETDESTVIEVADTVTEVQVREAIKAFENDSSDDYNSMEEYFEQHLDGFEYVVWDNIYY